MTCLLLQCPGILRGRCARHVCRCNTPRVAFRLDIEGTCTDVRDQMAQSMAQSMPKCDGISSEHVECAGEGEVARDERYTGSTRRTPNMTAPVLAEPSTPAVAVAGSEKEPEAALVPAASREAHDVTDVAMTSGFAENNNLLWQGCGEDEKCTAGLDARLDVLSVDREVVSTGWEEKEKGGVAVLEAAVAGAQVPEAIGSGRGVLPGSRALLSSYSAEYELLGAVRYG